MDDDSSGLIKFIQTNWDELEQQTLEGFGEYGDAKWALYVAHGYVLSQPSEEEINIRVPSGLKLMMDLWMDSMEGLYDVVQSGKHFFDGPTDSSEIQSILKGMYAIFNVYDADGDGKKVFETLLTQPRSPNHVMGQMTAEERGDTCYIIMRGLEFKELCMYLTMQLQYNSTTNDHAAAMGLMKRSIAGLCAIAEMVENPKLYDPELFDSFENMG